MNQNTPILVAPRPVRIASESAASSYAMLSGTPYRLVSAVADHYERAKIGGDIDIDEQKSAAFIESASSDNLASTRSSPRSSLPSEALEEFLSILNPSFFPPSSPILRARRNGASLPNYPYQYRARVLHSRGDSITLVEDVDRARYNGSAGSPEVTIGDDATNDHERHDADTFRWFATSTLSSPISRMHTRNPFPVGLLRTNQSSTPSPISPRAVPLPSPTPDEMMEVS